MKGDSTMKKKTLRDIDVDGKRVLIRVDFNVPIEDGNVVDDSRLKAALPTLEFIRQRGGRVILCSHLGRPKGKPDEKFRMDPVARRLSDLLGEEVKKIDDCVGPEAEEAASQLEPGKVLLLENTRFHQGEEDNDADFASQLANLADLYINDAFGAAHRAHASTSGVARHLPAVAGLLMEKEIDSLRRLLEDPDHPFAAVFGGAKISDKIGVIDRLLDSLDLLLIGGGMANTFLKSKGLRIGRSMVEGENLKTAERILAKSLNKTVLPVDVIVAESFEAPSEHHNVRVEEIPPDVYVMDIGPRTIELFQQSLGAVKTVMWNGPLGVTEMAPFAGGTVALARFVAETDAVKVIGGGDTAAMISSLGLQGAMTHVSTGGGAFLEYVEGKELPGIAALQER
jgi:phosphoglycerate kinase